MRHSVLAGAAAVLLGLTGCVGDNYDVTEGDAGLNDTPDGEFTDAPSDTDADEGDRLEVPVEATADLVDPEGSILGQATFSGTEAGAELDIELAGMAPGQHPVTLHQVGDCTDSEGATADEVFAATGPELDGEGYRDLPPLVVTENGVGELQTIIGEADLDQVLDVDGTAVVVGAAEDGQEGTEPQFACAAVSE